MVDLLTPPFPATYMFLAPNEISSTYFCLSLLLMECSSPPPVCVALRCRRVATLLNHTCRRQASWIGPSLIIRAPQGTYVPPKYRIPCQLL